MHTNKMKQNVSLKALSDIFNCHSLGNIQNAELLTGGEFNSVWGITTDSAQKYVIKIAPSLNTEVLTYERGITQSEVYTYQKLSALKTVHIPKIFGYGTDKTQPYQYLIMEFAEGKTLLNANLTDSERDKVMYTLGQAMAEMHNITIGDGFGYIQNGLKETWKDAYLSMVENIISDGLSKHARIPYLNEIKALINQNLTVLNEVKKPSLIHFDLWAGNIILNKNHALHCIIDCERAMLGDPLGEFISLDYITPFSVENNKWLIEGYTSVANEKIEFNRNEMIRLYLMRLYLGLIANIECYYRYPRLSAQFFGRYSFSKKFLKTTITELKRISL
ncbi:MAG: aminoglycoside phosphotransferase family protein [Oscillospiraceae bacterium]|nr:aminoglycoside phosphotransferase family protein [Oscillospiraceae bacterium]